MRQITEKHWINSYLIIHCPTSEKVSGASEQANKWASGPVLRSVFLVNLAHNAPANLDWPDPMEELDAEDRSLGRDIIVVKRCKDKKEWKRAGLKKEWKRAG